MQKENSESRIEFKPKFIERYSKLTDWEEFKKISLSFLRRSIRINTLKINVDDLKKKLEDKNQPESPPSKIPENKRINPGLRGRREQCLPFASFRMCQGRHQYERRRA